MIPKTIHYCWFGGNPLPEGALKCIESWKKYCPEYKIVCWDETNFDITCCAYVKEAYEAKKWAFVSDFARFKILYEYGGIYFDTDVELLKPLDEIISTGNYMGRERDSSVSTPAVNPGLGMAAVSGLAVYKELVEGYYNRHFIKKDGKYDLTTVVEYTTAVFEKYGLNNEDKIQFVSNVSIYPQEYFCPVNLVTGEINITKQTYSIHHYSASWLSKKERELMLLKQYYSRKFSDFMPEVMARYIGRFVAVYKQNGFNAAIKETVAWLNRQ